MNSSTSRRIAATACVAAITTVITTTPAVAKDEQGSKERPCFMIQSSWNNAEGPQPTCPDGRFMVVAPDVASSTQPETPGRITDFMP